MLDSGQSTYPRRRDAECSGSGQALAQLVVARFLPLVFESRAFGESVTTIVERHDAPPADARSGRERPDATGGAGILWFGILAPPLLMLLNLQLSYMMTPWVCRTGYTGAMHAVVACLLAVDVLAGLGAARRLRADWKEDTVVSRPGFMAMLGVLESALFAAVLIAQWLPHLFLGACQ